MWHAWERRDKCKRFWWDTPLGRPRRRLEDGIRKDLGEIGWGKWIQLVQDRDRWRDRVNTVTNVQVLGPWSSLWENLPPLSLQAFMVCSSVNRTTVDKKYLNQCLTVTNVKKKLTLTHYWRFLEIKHPSAGCDVSSGDIHLSSAYTQPTRKAC
jgi:hypothetical protein